MVLDLNSRESSDCTLKFNNRERTADELWIFQSENRREATPQLSIVHYQLSIVKTPFTNIK